MRLLLSIDRRETAEQAWQTVRLAAKYKDRGVVGIDLSGNPTVGQLDTWLPALRWARTQGLKLTLHAAEVCWCESVLQSHLRAPVGRSGWFCGKKGTPLANELVLNMTRPPPQDHCVINHLVSNPSCGTSVR